jgi:DNA-binding PadR family transcriptional regulator
MSTPDGRALTTTSYALLGFLYTRPYSAYELARQMKRDLHFSWPRAERAIYYEPKHLLAHGLVTATSERNGRRKRTVYSITPAGRRAFKHWLEQAEAAAPQLEFEAIVHATFAHRASKQALLKTLSGVREQAAAMHAQLQAQGREYLQTGGPFPDQLHLIALTGRFLIDYVALLERWSGWAEAEVRNWPTVASADQVDLDFAYEIFADAADIADTAKSAAASAAPRRPGR